MPLGGVSDRRMTDQNFHASDKTPTMVGHNARTNVLNNNESPFVSFCRIITKYPENVRPKWPVHGTGIFMSNLEQDII